VLVKEKYHTNIKKFQNFTNTDCLSLDLPNLICKIRYNKNYSGFDQTIVCNLCFTNIRTFNVTIYIYTHK